MTPAIQFLELAPDIILSIFAHCDISAVVSISQTCRYLHGLAFQKSVWLALLDDLKQRSILDSTDPDLRDLSTDELIARVKRLLTGPDTWMPSDAGFTPEISKRIILHPTIPHGPGILSWENEAKLFRGGRYVLFNNWRKLECWCVAEDRLVWKHVSALECSSVLAFAADESQEGDSLVVMVCQRTYPSTGPRKNYIEIIDLDLRKGTYNSLMTTVAPQTANDNPFSSTAICGTLACVEIISRQDRYLIIDWKMQTSFVLSGDRGVLSLIALIPRHIVLATVTDDENNYLYLVSTDDAMHCHGSPLAGLAGPATAPSITVDDVPKLITHRIPTFGDPTVGHFFQQISYSPSTKNPSSHPVHAILYSFDLQIAAQGRPPRCRARPRVPALRQMLYRDITYSGHTQVFDAYGARNEQILSPGIIDMRGEVDLMDCGDLVDVAPYSGALTYATHRHIVILYFR
ncbi:hypothetical protein FB451DRAFT_1562284 [Mycena latifolia]|nr:hypothetical protein FB451DRAFT_1562284 [Mycena latifolia]